MYSFVHSEMIRATHFHPVEVTIDSKTSVEEFLNKNMGFIQAEMERLDNRRDLVETRNLNNNNNNNNNPYKVEYQ